MEDFFKIPRPEILEKHFNNELDKHCDDNDRDNFIYLLQEREFIRLKEPIYKLGKTSNPRGRFNSYPKGSRIYLLIKCNDCNIAEMELLQKFRDIFVPRLDIGKEYFWGSLHDMIRTIVRYFAGEE